MEENFFYEEDLEENLVMAKACTMRFKEKNLVYLIYSQNTCYVTCTDKKPENIILDLEKGVWQIEKGECYTNESFYNIGESRWKSTQERFENLVIGVYDRTKIKHLASMSHQAGEATDNRNSYYDED